MAWVKTRFYKNLKSLYITSCSYTKKGEGRKKYLFSKTKQIRGKKKLLLEIESLTLFHP